MGNPAMGLATPLEMSYVSPRVWIFAKLACRIGCLQPLEFQVFVSRLETLIDLLCGCIYYVQYIHTPTEPCTLRKIVRKSGDRERRPTRIES